jgi:hypothetical protein
MRIDQGATRFGEMTLLYHLTISSTDIQPNLYCELIYLIKCPYSYPILVVLILVNMFSFVSVCRIIR